MLTISLTADFAYVFIVAIASIFLLLGLGAKVGSLRKRLKVPYPKVNGPDEFERAMRAHYNTLESMPMFYVLLVTCSLYSPILASVSGAAWIVTRVIYAIGYYESVEKRVPGAILSHVAELSMLVGSGLFIKNLFQQ
ncbi:glutathione S-transferase [Acrasis kona]|uniref:Glutathione S-transferase n=1 Tax=Acrasis kona TaxID=1008807 RepID=A0AAW2Z3Z0_9EUKA